MLCLVTYCAYCRTVQKKMQVLLGSVPWKCFSPYAHSFWFLLWLHHWILRTDMSNWWLWFPVLWISPECFSNIYSSLHFSPASQSCTQFIFPCCSKPQFALLSKSGKLEFTLATTCSQTAIWRSDFNWFEVCSMNKPQLVQCGEWGARRETCLAKAPANSFNHIKANHNKNLLLTYDRTTSSPIKHFTLGT